MTSAEMVHVVSRLLLAATISLIVGALALPWILRWWTRYADKVMDRP